MTQELIYSLWTLSIVIDLVSVVIDCNLHIFLPATGWSSRGSVLVARTARVYESKTIVVDDENRLRHRGFVGFFGSHTS